MKRILQSLAVSLLTIGMTGGIAAAATVTCGGSISNTGPGSTNTVSCVDTENNSVSCDNNIVISNDNEQSASSGSAFTTDNTSAGGSTSGSAENSNSTVVAVGASCAPVETAAVTPPAGGSGGATLGASTVAGGRGGAQVVAPVGGVGAGAGAGVASNKLAATAGLVGSASVVGIGLALKKRAFDRN
jgi:hypothetical protein